MHSEPAQLPPAQDASLFRNLVSVGMAVEISHLLGRTVLDSNASIHLKAVTGSWQTSHNEVFFQDCEYRWID